MPERDPHLYQNVLETLRIGIWLVDRERRIFFWNDGAEALTGYHRHEVVGHFSRDNVVPLCAENGCPACGATCPFSATMRDGKVREVRMQLLHKDGYRTPVRIRVLAIRDDRSSVIGLIVSFDQQKFAAERDRRDHHLAIYGCLDQITGIPNHGFTEFHFRENLASFTEYRLPFGILTIQITDLDHFGATYGREAADGALRVVAQTARNNLRPRDFLGRWTESEFLGILVNCTYAGLERGTERIRAILASASLVWWGDQHPITTSVGHAAAEGGDSMETMLERSRQSLKQSTPKHLAAAAGEQKVPPHS